MQKRVDNEMRDPKAQNNRKNNANIKPQRFDTSAYIEALDIGEICDIFLKSTLYLCLYYE